MYVHVYTLTFLEGERYRYPLYQPIWDNKINNSLIKCRDCQVPNTYIYIHTR